MVFDIKKSFDFDHKAAKEGVKMMVGSDPEEYILICRIPNPNYTAELTRVMQASGKILEYLKTQDEESYDKKDRELQSGVLAKTVVIDWGKKIALEGKILKYSLKVCAQTLKDYPDFRAACIEFASDVANYPAEIDLEDVKKKS